MTHASAKTLGVIHPGMMGISVANALIKAGHKACWASENRSEASVSRATQYHLHDCNTLNTLGQQCEVIFSVCPPAEALSVARATVATGFKGTYVDCNAVSPQTADSVSQVMSDANIDFVDGGIIGPPAWKPGSTRLYLSGTKATDITANWPLPSDFQ